MSEVLEELRINPQLINRQNEVSLKKIEICTA